jgi:ribosomal protein S21
MVEVKRKRGESFEAMLRRFNRRLQLSGRILQAKKIRFYKGEKSKTELKKSALRRIELQREYDKLKKMGKLPEEEVKRGRR